jgi:uncharacterized protein
VLIYLDTNVVIYLVERTPGWGAKAAARVAALRAAGDRTAISDLVRLECRVKPFAQGDARRLGQFDAFFRQPSVTVFGLSAAVCDRAAQIRAVHRFNLGDALNLAAAVKHGCGAFLTADARLSKFSGLTVEVLT